MWGAFRAAPERAPLPLPNPPPDPQLLPKGRGSFFFQWDEVFHRPSGAFAGSVMRLPERGTGRYRRTCVCVRVSIFLSVYFFSKGA